AAEAAAASGEERTVALSFDHAASAATFVLPLLELYDWRATVTVSTSDLAAPETAAALATLAASPLVDLAPRVEPGQGPMPSRELDCSGPANTSAGADEAALSRLRRELAALTASLAEISGSAPAS